MTASTLLEIIINLYYTHSAGTEREFIDLHVLISSRVSADGHAIEIKQKPALGDGKPSYFPRNLSACFPGAGKIAQKGKTTRKSRSRIDIERSTRRTAAVDAPENREVFPRDFPTADTKLIPIFSNIGALRNRFRICFVAI